MKYKEAVKKIAEETGLPQKIVDRTYRAYWKVVREHITSLPLKEIGTEEEFMKLRPNVNIPSIGKLNVTLERWKGVKRKFKSSLSPALQPLPNPPQKGGNLELPADL